MEKEERSKRFVVRDMTEARREVNWESFGTVKRRAVRLLMFGEGS